MLGIFAGSVGSVHIVDVAVVDLAAQCAVFLSKNVADRTAIFCVYLMVNKSIEVRAVELILKNV